ncbi:hypothetical protein DYB31_015033, partial [Aphanomyces astaci]
MQDDDGARVSTPGQKREADGSPDVSPPTDRPETRSPFRRPMLVSAADLALVPTTPLARTGTDGPTLTLARTGTDGRDADAKTLERFSIPVPAPGFTSLVVEGYRGMVLEVRRREDHLRHDGLLCSLRKELRTLKRNHQEEILLVREATRDEDISRAVGPGAIHDTQEHTQCGEDSSPWTRDQLERERHANEEVLRQVEEARTCLETEKLQFRDQEATLFRERSVQDRPSYKWNKELWNSNKGRLGRRTMPVAARSRVHAAFHSPGAATGVVTQVTLRDLLVVEDPDMEDTEGTTVVLLALREADPEETALVPDSPTHPWSPVRLHVVNARKYAAKFDSVDRTIPLEHFLAKLDFIQKKYGLNDTQVVRIFDDRLTSCG